jgi:hypothetical protein
MPQIPSKKKQRAASKSANRPTLGKQKERYDTKVFADRLFYCMVNLTAIRKELDMLWEAMYTVGLTDRGPVTETEDDIPF